MLMVKSLPSQLHPLPSPTLWTLDPNAKAVSSGQADPLNGDKAATKKGRYQKARIEIPLSADTVVSRFSQRSHKSFTHIWCALSDPNYRNPNCRQHSSLLQGHQKPSQACQPTNPPQSQKPPALMCSTSPSALTYSASPNSTSVFDFNTYQYSIADNLR